MSRVHRFSQLNAAHSEVGNARSLGGATPADDDSWSELIEQHWSLVEAICHNRLSGMRRADVEDAVQDTFVQFLATDRSKIYDLPAWLTTVAVRACAHILREKYRRNEDLVEETPPISKDDPIALTIDDMSFEAIIADLSPLERQLLRGVYVQQQPYREVATQLHLSPVHARQLAFRARNRLRELLRGQDDDLDLAL